MQASQWKSHCEELTQHYDAQVAQDAERISEMERNLDDVSSKFIEASEKLEQWESWWNSDAQVAEPIERQHEVLGPIIEEERQQQPMTPIVMAPPTIPQEFCRRLFRQSSLTKISPSGRMRATNPAIPVWMHKLFRLLLQLLP